MSYEGDGGELNLSTLCKNSFCSIYPSWNTHYSLFNLDDKAQQSFAKSENQHLPSPQLHSVVSQNTWIFKHKINYLKLKLFSKDNWYRMLPSNKGLLLRELNSGYSRVDPYLINSLRKRAILILTKNMEYYRGAISFILPFFNLPLSFTLSL